jgi:hypothetical protein
MNERIFELAQQAGFEPHYEPDGTFSYSQQFEKFAQLIIQKCIEEAGDPADGLILDDTWHDGVRASVWSIKQYFGIEYQTRNLP